MQPPDELMVRTFLPSMRQLLAHRLRSEGYTQGRISAALGVTQASVSVYLSSKTDRAYVSLASLSVSRRRADRQVGELVAAVSKGGPEGVAALAGVWEEVLGSGGACDAHRRLYPSLAGCDYCVRAYGPRGGALARAVAEVGEAVRLIESSDEFPGVMPEVSVNVACAAEGATAPAEVVAVPGRIVKVKDRARAMLPPEPGASAHMSQVLLLARTRDPSASACINLRYDSRMESAMRRWKLRSISIRSGDGRGGDDPTVEALKRKLAETNARFDAVVDLGGGGIEPNVYLFGKGAPQVAAAALRLARTYSSG